MRIYERNLDIGHTIIGGKLFYRIIYHIPGRSSDAFKTMPGTRLYGDFNDAWQIKDFISCSAFYTHCQSQPELKVLYDEGYRCGVELLKTTPQDTKRLSIFSSDWLLEGEINQRYMQVSLPSSNHYRARRQGIWDGFKLRSYAATLEKELHGR